eukprot:COSAG05_NODE_2491_length_2992_cov_6.079157_1_plen_81_part_00
MQCELVHGWCVLERLARVDLVRAQAEAVALLGKLLDIIKLLCIECKFSDLGTIVILGRLEPPFYRGEPIDICLSSELVDC